MVVWWTILERRKVGPAGLEWRGGNLSQVTVDERVSVGAVWSYKAVTRKRK
jgi:hypothetical protein